MLLKGRLRTWNDDRGFGFIAPEDGGRQLFVHISAFPRNAPRPSIGETIFYEAGYSKDGRERAIRAQSEAYHRGSLPSRFPSRSTRRSRGQLPHRSPFLGRIGLLLLLGVGAYFFLPDHAPRDQAMGLLSGPSSDPAAFEEYEPEFSCDGRTHCSQMTSCREATFFTRNCPRTEMDGDGDGIPCERQWC